MADDNRKPSRHAAHPGVPADGTDASEATRPVTRRQFMHACLVVGGGLLASLAWTLTGGSDESVAAPASPSPTRKPSKTPPKSTPKASPRPSPSPRASKSPTVMPPYGVMVPDPNRKRPATPRKTEPNAPVPRPKYGMFL